MDASHLLAEVPVFVRELVLGHWPATNVESMSRRRDAYLEASKVLTDASDQYDVHARSAEAALGGDSGAGLARRHRSVSVAIRNQAAVCQDMGEQCGKLADSTLQTQHLLIAMGIALGAQLVYDSLLFWQGGGFKALADRVAAEEAMRVAAEKFAVGVAEDVAAGVARRAALHGAIHAAGIGALISAVAGVGAQVWDILDGARHGFDSSLLLEQIAGGAVGGAAGAEVGRRLAPGVLRKLSGRAESDRGRLLTHVGGTMLIGGAGGAAGGVAGAIPSLIIHHGDIHAFGDIFSALHDGAITGFGGGFIGAAARALRAHEAGAEVTSGGGGREVSTLGVRQRDFAGHIKDLLGSGEQPRVETIEPAAGSGDPLQRLTFPDGTQVLHTVAADPRQAHAQFLTSLAGEAVGAKVPAVHVVGEHVFTEVVPGSTGREAYPLDRDAAERFHGTSAGLRLGALDALVGVPNRDSDSWVVDRSGDVWGIGNTRGFADTAAIGPFAKQFLEHGPDGEIRWKEHGLTRSEVQEIRQRVEQLGPVFSAARHSDWHDTMLRRVDMLEQHASPTGRQVRTQSVGESFADVGECGTRSADDPRKGVSATLRNDRPSILDHFERTVQDRRSWNVASDNGSADRPAAHTASAKTRAGADGFVSGTANEAKQGLEPDHTRANEQEAPAGDHLGMDQIIEPSHGQGPAPDLIDPGAVDGFYHQLIDAAKAASEGSGRDVSEHIQQFTLQRAVFRIFTADPDSWVLKGGQSMLVRIPGARPTTDIDLVATSPLEGAEMAAHYRAALGCDHGDFLRFEYEDEMPLDNGGVRMFHRAYIGDMEVMRVGADLNPPREIPMWHEPSAVQFPEQIVHTDDVKPDLRVISPQDTLAHKVAGMYTEGYRTEETKCDDCILLQDTGLYTCQKAGSQLPYRPQDMADVLLLALHTSFDGQTTQNMLRQELAWRMDQGVTLNVPSEFKLPNPDWANWFSQHLGRTDALPFRTLNETLPLARDFLSPLLSPEDLHGQWDPQHRRWVGDETPATDSPASAGSPAHEATPAAVPPEGVRRIEGTGAGEPSTIAIDPENKMPQWDQLASDERDGSNLDDFLDRLAAHEGLSPTDKVYALHRTLDTVGYKPEPISGMDSRHLRFYSHQSGEEYIHAAALMLNPDTTVEIAFQPNGVFKAYSEDAYGAHIVYMGELPEGMTADQANAVAFSRWVRSESTHDLSHAELTRELLDLHAQPLRSALRIRQRLIEDYGIASDRIRLAEAKDERDFVYTETRWLRAHLLTLSHIREHPVEARQTMVDAMLGDGETAVNRAARVDSVVNRVLSAHEDSDSSPKKYTLLWVRDSRPFGTHGAELDTRPQQIRQIIETLRQRQPDRQIMLVGDDLFAERPELRELWHREGVLHDVDTSSLVKFWQRDGLTRPEQSLVFHRLATQRDVVQIGMESGALEMQTVLGIPTAYLSAREYLGNKGNRWAHYFEPWEYGRTVQLLDEHGNRIYDPASGLPRSEFKPEGEPLPAPLKTIERVPVGPDLPDPANRRGQPMAVHRPAKVSLTASRIIGLIDSGELDRWGDRLGRSVEMKSEDWAPWQARDWQNSERYADQLNRWLHTEATTPEAIATKWDAIRLALKGVVEPGYTQDETYHGTSVVHPYFTLATDHPVPAGIADRIAQAYAAEPDTRPAAVVIALRDLFDTTRIRDQALRDHGAFGLDESELQTLHEALDRVISHNTLHSPVPYDAPPGGSAWDAAGAATHSRRPPLDRLWVPDHYLTHILDGGESGGGHRYGTGIPGKTEFPERWDDPTVVRTILDIAAAPTRALFQSNGYWNVIGERDDVTVTAIVRPDGRIRAAWPEFGRGVFRNPPTGS
ncbi:nucleotidyl transferase AbiEii/AbiGii toxin family protein [Nocardia aobensis]|uniref:nucleotidyl transferase AbiEii/AbiGii toxin family protein n=1 Tax=Nocardia aobensis TaxID=257277 RepID=UPI00056150D6|nr:nucleotidyl transferase AbiEii/AbiGii toxin family protein [Nocardia aobensis]